MRDPEIIETELMEISAIADDTVKFERIVAWCASHPDEVPFALHQLMGGHDKHPSQTSYGISHNTVTKSQKERPACFRKENGRRRERRTRAMPRFTAW